MTHGPVKVLYVAGISHSGTTILGHVLGEAEGFFYGGEIRNIWQRGVIENRLCSCGELFRNCTLWSTVLRGVDANQSPWDVADMARLHSHYVRLRALPALAGLGPRRSRSARSLERYRANLALLYGSVRATTGTDVIVDSSKSPWYALSLEETREIELRILHLVRDPRANVYSFTRRRRLSAYDIAARGLRWGSWHLATEMLARVRDIPYTRLRYEDFVEHPRESLGAVFDELALQPPALSAISDSRVRLEPKHIFSGNRARGIVGDVELRLDSEWETGLSSPARATLVALTLPLFHRYGYRVRSDSQ